jgi:hypothetical protein
VIQPSDGFSRFEAAAEVNSAAGPALVVPQLALGGGYRGVLMVSNKSAARWNGTVSLTQGDHAPWAGGWSLDGNPGADSGLEVELAPHGTGKLLIRGDDQLRDGYLAIAAASGSQTGSITETLFHNYMSGAELVDSTGVRPATAARTWVIPVEKAGPVNTGLAFAAADSGQASEITRTLFDSAGVQAGQVSTSYRGHTARFFAGPFGWFPELPDGFVGKLRIGRTSPWQ